ncbi:MAG: PEGA domain-containing protein [Nannocystaceae bacterium]
MRPAFAVVERDYTLRVELYDVRAGQVVDVAEERCALCSVAEARQRLEEAAAKLVQPLLIPPAAAPKLTLSTTPKGARILVDGVDLGPAPLSRSLPPGPHAIEAIEHGHRRLRHPVELREGERVDVHLVLTPIPKPVPPQKPRWNGWIAVGVGAPIAAAGVAPGPLSTTTPRSAAAPSATAAAPRWRPPGRRRRP